MTSRVAYPDGPAARHMTNRMTNRKYREGRQGCRVANEVSWRFQESQRTTRDHPLRLLLEHQGCQGTTKERTSERISKGYRSDTAPRGISKRVRGRYPGSQDLRYRLPMNWRFHSGTAIRKLEMALSIHPHLLTVAGAAQAS